MDPISQHSTTVHHLTANLCALGFDVDSILNAGLPSGLKGMPHRYDRAKLTPDLFLHQSGKDRQNSSAMVEMILHFLLNRFVWEDVVKESVSTSKPHLRPDESALYVRKVREKVQADLTNLNIVFPCIERHHVTTFKQLARALLEVLQGTKFFPLRVNVEAVLTEAKVRCAAFLLQLSVGALHCQLGGEYVTLCDALPLCVLEAIRAKQVVILKERAAAYVEVGKRMQECHRTLREVSAAIPRRAAPIPMSPTGGVPPEPEAVAARLKWMNTLANLHTNSFRMDHALAATNQYAIDGADFFPGAQVLPVPLVPYVREIAGKVKESSRRSQPVAVEHLDSIVDGARTLLFRIQTATQQQKVRTETLQSILEGS